MTAPALTHLADDPELAVQLAVGTQHFRGGVITLTVHGDGRATVVRRDADSEERAEGELTADERRALGDELDSLGLVELRPAGGSREPDDVPVEVMVAHGGRALHEQSLWYGDRYTDAALDRLIRRFDALVERFG